jgi:hypothetical protein
MEDLHKIKKKKMDRYSGDRIPQLFYAQLRHSPSYESSYNPHFIPARK